MVKLMKVPKTIFRQTEDEKIHAENLMEKFFVNAKKYVESKLKLKKIDKVHFKIKCADLAYSSEKVNSDNRITYVEFKEKYVLAGMLETRTAFNDLQFTFLRDLSCLQEKVL